MKLKEENYKEYRIEIHPQPKTGDNTQVFLGVWKDDQKVFSVWEKISGTEARSMTTNVTDSLEQKGLVRVKRMIDDKNFKDGSEYEFWESAN